MSLPFDPGEDPEAGASYYDTIPVDNIVYFKSGGDGKYNGQNQEPKITNEGANALYGCSAEEAEGKYEIKFVQGTYQDEELGKIESPEHEGVVAGTHYYMITDKTTGQVISLKFEVVIEKSIYYVTNFKKPEKALYFTGEYLGGLFVTWTNDTTGHEVTYTPGGTAGDFAIAEENGVVTAYPAGVEAGIEQVYANNLDNLPILRNNYEVETVDLRYNVLPKCYVLQSGAKTYYGSLANALNSTKDATVETTVVAMPFFDYGEGENITRYSSVMNANGYDNEISEDCEIGQYVTLWLPFDHTTESASSEGKNFIRTAAEGALPHLNTFNLDEDPNIPGPDYRKNLVTVRAGVTIINKGKINISAEVTGGNGGTELSGIVSGRYAELKMKSAGEEVSTIASESGSRVNCYGFITKSLATNTSLNPKIDLASGSEMTTMFTINEHRGGGVFVDLCGGLGAILGNILSSDVDPNTSPFNQYFIQSVSADINVNYGATLKGHYILFMDNNNVEGDIVMVGNNSSAFLQLNNSAGTARITYDVEQNKNIAEIKSDAIINPLKVSVAIRGMSKNIPTNNVYLPIPHYWHIEFLDMEKESGEPTTLSAPVQRVKILPGGYIKVHKNVEATVKAAAVYNSASEIPPTATYLHFVYPDKGPGQLVVDGTLKVTEALGGNITAGSDGAKIVLAANSATTTEASGAGTDADPTTTVNRTFNARGDILTSLTSAENKQFDANGSYFAKSYNDNGTTKVAWVKPTVNITYVDAFLDEDGNVASYGDEAGVVKQHTVPGNFAHGLSYPGYGIEGYYTDKELTNSIDPLTVLFDTKVYIKWKPTPTYPITYEPSYPGGSTGMTFSGGVAEAPAGAFTDWHTSSSWDSNIEKQYYLAGWSTTPNSTTPETSFEVTEDGLTLYGVWKEKLTITVQVSSATVTVANKTFSSNGSFYVVKGTSLEVSATWSKDTKVLTIGGIDHTSGASYTFDSAVTIVAKSESCIAAGTLITLADGTVKKVEDLLETDILLVFDHETGKFVEAPILFIERDGWAEYDVINLKFSDGRVTRLIYEHALFDLTLNKYVYITEENLTEFIGHEFAVEDGGKIATVTLTEAFMTREYTGCYSLVTAYHLNYFIDGLFSIPGGIEGLFNIFEYGDGLKYDEEKMQADIEKYGLYTYEDFAEYIPEEVYNAFPAAYFKVSIGKGYLTFDKILEYIEVYVVRNGLM